MNQMKFLHAPVSVEVNFDRDGRLTLRSFIWEGRVYQVSATGRCWREGQHHHFLVMTTFGETFELALDTENLRWWVEKRWRKEAIV